MQTSLVAGLDRALGHRGAEAASGCPRLCSGEALGCFALTEPDAGSDPASMRTRAKKTDSGWTITGNKMWISMGNVAELALVFAQTDPEKKHRGLACFLVPTSTDGYSAQEIHGKLGLRSSDTAEISLDEVEVPDDALLGEVGDGFKIAMSSLDNGRYSVAAGCVGICDGCVDASVAYAKERKQFGVPIASFQLVQELIADMIVKRDAARLLVYRAGELKDRGVRNTVETSIAKYYATEAAVECANAAIQVHGGSGYVDDYPVERYLRDARVTTLYEGTSQIHKLIIGRDATGINAMVPPSATVVSSASRAGRRRRRRDDGRRNRADRGARRLPDRDLRARQQGAASAGSSSFAAPCAAEPSGAAGVSRMRSTRWSGSRRTRSSRSSGAATW